MTKIKMRSIKPKVKGTPISKAIVFVAVFLVCMYVWSEEEEQPAELLSEKVGKEKVKKKKMGKKKVKKKQKGDRDWSLYYPKRIEPKLSFSKAEKNAVDQSPPPDVFHQCSCLDYEYPNPVKQRKYDWLHVPKTGTSFIIPYWNLALQGLTIDYDFDAFYGVLYGLSYDLVIQDRYPLELYSTNPTILASYHTRHGPVEASLNHDIVSIVRDPTDRILSAFYYSQHTDGLNITQWADLGKTCGLGKDAWCYANYPGVSNCMTKMLIGERCSVPFELNAEHLEEAKRIVKNMAFVGLTSEYNEAICQFHKVFGGLPRGSQHQVEDRLLASYRIG